MAYLAPLNHLRAARTPRAARPPREETPVPETLRLLLPFAPSIVALIAALAVLHDAAHVHRAAYALHDHSQEQHHA